MKYKKIIIIYNSRIPTEKANGYQTFKTAEALINQKKEVEIWGPKRFNIRKLKNRDIQDYYNLINTPKIIKFNVIDLLSLINFENIFTKYFKFISNIILTFTFLISISLRIMFQNQKETIFFTRDVNLASILIFIFPKIRQSIFIELHNLPLKKARINRQVSILKKCMGIITLTKIMKKELINYGLDESKILYEPDAVDISQFKLKITKNHARNILKLPKNIKIFLYLGKFHTLGMEKGIPEIIKSIVNLDLSEEYKIYIVGGPISRVNKYIEILKRYKISPDKVEFLGRQEIKTIPIWLKAADILLMPHPKTTFYEKYVSPLKLFEYMCSNNPIIASNLEAIKEILSHKNNSYLVNAGSPLSISKAIKYLMINKDFSKKLAQKAYSDVDNFSWQKRGLRINKFISEIKS